MSRAGSMYLGQNRLCSVRVYSVVIIPDAGEDEGDDGEAGHAPHHAHLHVQEPGGEVRPLYRPELQAAILKECVRLEYCRTRPGSKRSSQRHGLGPSS